MIRARNKPAFAGGAMKEVVPAASAAKSDVDEWEMRPGGMLVQKRGPDSESAVAAAAAPVPTIRVKVKYGSAYYEIYLSAQSTFGDLKKMIAERTGVHHQDQKIVYKDKERESGAYLDSCGVRDGSKLAMVVDPAAHARRLLEARRAARLERAATALKNVAAEVDKLSLQLVDVEAAISRGEKGRDKEILNLTEQLMMQLVKLDGVAADGDLKLQRGMQVRRIQKYVETLDVLKIKNAKIAAATVASKQRRQPVVVTTEWEMFDSCSASSSTATSNSTASSSIASAAQWQLL